MTEWNFLQGRLFFFSNESLTKELRKDRVTRKKALFWFKYPYGELGECNKIMPMFGRHLIDRHGVYFFKYTSCRNQSSDTRTLVWKRQMIADNAVLYLRARV